ncbi:hypothetical protein GJAV_G00168930 [Gymnothorax javanicus]|nr:hypothetical protein GJAV_G00168930 [Gymnothorax javanicus]
MKETLLNHLVPDSGSGQEPLPGENAAEHGEVVGGLVPAREHVEDLLSRESTEDLLTREHAKNLLTRECAEDLLLRERGDDEKQERTEEWKERTDSPTREETGDSLDNGLAGASEGTGQPEVQAPLVSMDSEEHLPAALDSTTDAADPPNAAAGDEPPMDWLEPLEEDDDAEDDGQSWELDLLPGERRVNGREDAEEDSLAGESEMSGSLAGSDRNSSRKGGRRGGQRTRWRRPQSVVDEDWEDWPELGAGWKRKEVMRRSGFSVGKADTYYMSPRGYRLRSKIELAKHLPRLDLTTFDFKSGHFRNDVPHRRFKKLKKFRKMSRSVEKWRSSSNLGSAPQRQRAPQSPAGWAGSVTTAPRSARPHPPAFPSSTPLLAPVSLSSAPHSPLHHTQRLRPLIKQEAGSPDCTRPELPAPECSRCGGPLPAEEPWRKQHTSLCMRCKAWKKKCDSSDIVFRKWLPCGQCRACLVTENCGVCASCRKGQLNHGTNKPVRCRKRKCLCPIRTKTAREKVAEVVKRKVALLNLEQTEQYTVSEAKKVKPNSIKAESQSELTVCIDREDEDGGEDVDDEAVFRRRLGSRRCGSCAACLRTADCGSCKVCAGRAELSASGGARRVCRLRRCLMPAGFVQNTFAGGWMGLGSPRPHYGYSRIWGDRYSSKALWDGLEFSEDEDDEDITDTGRPGDHKLQQETDKDASTRLSQNCFKANRSSAGVPDSGYTGASTEHAEGSAVGQRSKAGLELGGVDSGKTGERAEVSPMISGIFSLAEGAQVDGEALDADEAGVPFEPELMALMKALCRTPLPRHWVALLAEGPCLQLLQCSRRSTMADTVLFIHAGFSYQINVQGQPLLLTHRLYRQHPPRLHTADLVAALLLDLERYAVCQGFPEPPNSQQPLLPTRAAICAFLVPQTEERCERCRAQPRGP